MENLTKKVVKMKKLQIVSNNFAILIPKKWAEELDWNRNTKLILEFLPHRKIMILSQSNEKIALAPINTKEGEIQRDRFRDKLAKEARKDEEVSDIVPV